MALNATLQLAPAFCEVDMSDRAPLLIDPWLPAGSVTLLFGTPSAGKSHTMNSMTAALIRGELLWDVFPTQQSRVLIVQADMNNALYQERLRLMGDAFTNDVQLLMTDAMPFDVCAVTPADPIIAAAREFAPRIVFVDTLRKTHAADENESNAPDKVYAAWRRLFPGAAFVFLHHSRKVSTQGNSDTMVREAFRGSGAWAASADTLILVKRYRRKGGGWQTRLYFVRTRSCEEPKPLILRLNDKLLLENTGDASLEARLTVWLSETPGASQSDAVHWLQTLQTVKGQQVSRATAYRVWDRVSERLK